MSGVLLRNLAAIVLPIVAASLFATAAIAQAVIAPDQAWRMARAGEITIIDIRRGDEWLETGLPQNAERATVRFARGPGEFLRRIAKLTKGDKSQPIALICAAGFRSKYAARLLANRGYSHVLDISEGMLGNDRGPGWLDRDLPVSACTDCQ